MRRFGMGAMAVGTGMAVVLATRGLLAQQADASQRHSVPQLVTIAQGEAKVTPDRATIEISVQTRASTAAAAGSENARKQTTVIAALRRTGLTPDQISTTGYNLYPEMQYDREGQQPRVSGYVAMNTVRVELHRIEQAGQVIDAVLAAGANMISSLNFYASNADSARQVAIASAVTKARADAEAMARAAGGSVGGVLEISIMESGSPVPLFREMAAQARSADSTPINPGLQTVTVTISARWAYLSAK